MRNGDYVVRGLGAAVLSAEMNVKRLPEARGISLPPTVNFEDDTVENQKLRHQMERKYVTDTLIADE